MSIYTFPNNTYLVKVALKSAPGVPDVEALPFAVPGSWTPQIAGVARKKLQTTTYTIPENTYLAKVAVESAPGAPDVKALPLAVPGGWTPPRLQELPGKSCK